MNENKEYISASLFKLWLMSALMQKVDSGEIKLDDNISSEFSLNQESYRSLIISMITVSDNNSSLIIQNFLTPAYVELYLKEIGLASSTFSSPPKTTAKDIALFYDKLYRGKLASKTSTDFMLKILKGQKVLTKLPKYLPSGATVAHKTGEIDSFSHDAGIVFLKDRDYIIVVMTNSNDPLNTNDGIAKFSKEVYDYMESL